MNFSQQIKYLENLCETAKKEENMYITVDESWIRLLLECLYEKETK